MMKSYTLSMTGNGEISEIFAGDDQAAIDQATDLLGDGVVVAEQWDQDGVDGDDQPCKRILFWADEESAENDPGISSIASLSTIGRP